MAIEPVSLPSAAGIEYGSGDVRHFSPGDAVDVPGLQNPTRYLAERDNLLAETLNEVVEQVNNGEQVVYLPVVRTVLSPNESATVSNYRIPVGFEARILNAAVASTPASPSIQLNVFYSSNTFGSTSGAQAVSTATEFTGGTSFYETGEFIIQLNNTSASALTLTASVILTVRPVGGTGSLLAATVVPGPAGQPGPTGPPGVPGQPGSGGAGTPGMIWSGTFQFGNTYRAKEVVSYSLYGSLLGSFICNTTTMEDPQTSYLTSDGVWSPVALGSQGPIGSSGTQGSAGTNTTVPNYLSHIVYGTFTTASNWTSTASGPYDTVVESGVSVTYIPLLETFINSEYANPDYLSSVQMLAGVMRLTFNGDGTFTLPKAAYGAQIDYTNTQISMIASINGVLNYPNTGPVTLPICIPNGTDSFLLITPTGGSEQTVAIFIGGFDAN